jgi:DNA repair protein RadC
METTSTAPAWYAMRSHLFVLDNPTRQYILRVRDLPAEEKPREKLLAGGPGALTTPELLAVVLSTGTKKEDVLNMASRIIKDYGEKSVMRQTDAALLAADLDIPLGKAMQIVASAELGRRFFAKNNASAPVLRTAKDVFDYVGDMRHLPKEHLRGIYLNAHYKVIHDEIISIGTIDANIVHPREVFRPAVEYAASGVILVHNHPSGIADASEPDLEVTRQLVNAGSLLGIDLIDHIIVTANGFRNIPISYGASGAA